MRSNEFVRASGILVIIHAVLLAVQAAYTYLFKSYVIYQPSALVFLQSYYWERLAVTLALQVLLLLGFIGFLLTQSTLVGKIGAWLAIVGVAINLGTTALQNYLYAIGQSLILLNFIRTWWFSVFALVAFAGPFVGLLLSGIVTLRRHELGRWSAMPLVVSGWALLSYGVSLLFFVILLPRQLNGTDGIHAFETRLYLYYLVTSAITAIIWVLFGWGLLRRISARDRQTATAY